MRLPPRRDHRRTQIETALARVISILLDMDEIILRNRQAIRRSPHVRDVLDPAVRRLEQMKHEMEQVKQELSEAWKNGQQDKWG